MTKRNPENISPAKLKAIWQQISPADWLSVLQEYKPSHGWSLGGTTIKGLCIHPNHADTSPSLVINLERGSAHCFGASCNYSEWNPIRFFADLAQVSYGTAVRKLKSRFGIKLPSAFTQNIQHLDDNDHLKKLLLRALNVELINVMQHPEEKEYAYAKQVGLVNWLGQRKFPESTIHLWPVGILPPRDRLYQYFANDPSTAKLADKACEYLSKYLAIPGSPMIHEGSLVFFFFTSPTTIGRLRIRHPATKDFYAVEDPYEKNVGYFGLNMFPHLLGDMSKHPAYAVEGEMDALAVLSHQSHHGLDDVCIIATGGSMESNLDELKEFGFQELHIIPDNDTDGRGWARNLISKNSVVTRVYCWPENTSKNVKDVDDAIRTHGFDAFYTSLSGLQDFPRNLDWVSAQLEEELEELDKDDLRARAEKAAEYGKVLKDGTERAAFVDQACVAYGLDKESILQEMVPDDDTPKAFVQRLGKKLKEEYYFLSEKGIGAATVISAWSNRKRIVRTFTMSSRSSTQASLEADLGSLEDYIYKELGMPTFLEYKLSPKGIPVEVPMNQKPLLIGQCFQSALSNIIANTTPKDWLMELGQGIHWIEDFDEESNAALLVVNGTKFFKGTPKGKGMTFESLESPIAGKYFFKLQSRPWSTNLKTTKDFDDGMNFDPKDIFEKLLDIFKQGWRFKNHDLEAEFLAADVLYTTIFSVFDHLSMTDITGESHSGKTTLMQVIAGNEYRDLRLCEAAILIDDFSAAAVRQSMNGCRLRLYLDEFEDSDFGMVGRIDRRSIAVREVLELIRGMSSGSSVAIRGTSTGEHQEFDIHFPVTIGGIFTMREPRDLNRFIHIKTRFMEGFRDPVSPIREKYSEEDMAKLRRGVTTCLLPRIPEILAAYKEVKKEFVKNESLPSDMMTRLKDNLLPAAAIMKVIGKDYVKFMAEFSKVKLEELREQGGTVKESGNIWNHVLHTQVNLSKFAPDGDLIGVSSLSKILSGGSTLSLLNGSDLGAYYLDKQKWLIVFWQKAINGILRNSTKYGRAQYPGKLKHMADADPRVVPKEKLRSSNFLKKEVWKRVGSKISYDEISVIDLTQTLDIDDTTEEAERDMQTRDGMLEDIPDAASLVDGKVSRGNFDV